MNPNKRTLIVKAGDTRILVASINYQKLQAQDMITWKKNVYSEDEVKENPSRLLFAIEDNGEIFSSGKELSTTYKFVKQDVGKYIKFYSYCKEFNALAQCLAFYVEGEHDTDVDISDVERIGSDSKELCIGERLELKAIFSIAENKVSPKTNEHVKWMVRIDGEEERLIVNGFVITGSEIEIFIPENWAKKEVILMPYLHEHSEDVSYQVVVNSTPIISEICWYVKGKPGFSPKRKDIMLNHTTTLFIKVSQYELGNKLELIVRQSKNRRIKGDEKEFKITGVIKEDGIVEISDFSIECDFRDDNLNFEEIEFYQKDNITIVGRLKENFGWTYIEDNNQIKIYVNIDLKIEYLAPGYTELDYMNSFDTLFKRVLENSSDKKLTGKLFFTGTSTLNPPQVVPVAIIDKKTPKEIMGLSIQAGVSANSDEIIENLIDLSETFVHELFHTLMVSHPFENTQATDTTLINLGWNRYKTVVQTDSNIQYNLMIYGSVSIDGHLLSDLWKEKRPEYLTKGQLKFIIEQIDLQKKGIGTYKESYGEGMDKELNHHSYWSYYFLGAPVKRKIEMK